MREELLERLRALAARTGRPRGRVEREEWALQVAARPTTVPWRRTS